MMFDGKTVVVFGGTGSIGSLIVETVLKYDVHAVRVFCNVENELHKCERKWGNSNIRYLLGDIRDYRRVKRAVKDADYVFSCAAVKHVPICEYNPMEAVDVNIHGLENIIEACFLYNIGKLLHISTDKAVEPTTLMGATKLIGERLCQIRDDNKGKAITRISCIRLGNVWGSRGSLITIIEKCIKAGVPIPLTDINMERYFIMPEELQCFILKVFEAMEGGEIFVPKLRNYRIVDVIKEMAGAEYRIDIIGCRRGEKLREDLLTEGEMYDARDMEDMWVIG